MTRIAKLMVQVAVTGADTVPLQSPYIPITPEQIVEECYKCWKAEAAMVHLHIRDLKNGKPTGSLEVWREVLSKVKQKCGNLIIGVSSGGAYGLTPAQRLAVVTEFEPEISSFTPESVSNTLHHVVPRIRELKHD